jgi:hypothetical protein
MYSPQESARIQILRAKVNANTISPEELREGMALLAQARAGAHVVSAKSKAAKAPKAPVDSNALLGELDGM